MKIRKLHIILIGLLIATMLASCSSTGSSPSAPSSGTGGGQSSPTPGTTKNYPQGVTDTEIVIGMTGPQSGPQAVGDSSRKAAESYLKYVNENGGVNGRKIRLVAYDNMFEPTRNVQMMKKLVEEDKVYAIVGALGTVANLATVDYIKQKGIPQIMIGSGSGKLVDPPVRNILGLGILNYGIEGKILLEYAVNNIGAKKLAIAYQADDVGKEPFEAIKASIGQYAGVEIVTEVSFQGTDTELSAQAQRIQQAKPDAILSFGLPAPTANLKKELYNIGMKDVPFLMSNGGAQIFQLAAPEIWEGAISTSPFPMPGESDDESLQLYMERFPKDYPNEPVGLYSQSGWAMMEVFIEGLRRAGDDLSWENLLNTFYTFDKWDGSMFAGISFNENNHYGTTSAYLVQARGGKFVQIGDIITADPSAK